MGEPLPLDDETVVTLLREVEAQRDALLALTCDLVGCRSDSQSADNSEFEAEAHRCQNLISAWLTGSGSDVERWSEPPRYPVVAGKLAGTGGGRSLAFNSQATPRFVPGIAMSRSPGCP